MADNYGFPNSTGGFLGTYYFRDDEEQHIPPQNPSIAAYYPQNPYQNHNNREQYHNPITSYSLGATHPGYQSQVPTGPTQTPYQLNMPHNTSVETQHSSQLSYTPDTTTATPSPTNGNPPIHIPEQLSPTYQCSDATCPQKDKIFQGPGAKTAWRRHLNTHSKPFTCPEPHCSRHSEGNGFSRKDNLNYHMSKKHPDRGKFVARVEKNRNVGSATRERLGMGRRTRRLKFKDMFKSLREVLDRLEEAYNQMVETDSEEEEDDDD